MDRISKEARSRNMAAIKAGGNKTTELQFIKFLRLNKISGWRRNSPLYGHPDFVFKKEKTAVFVDGCFWHGCKKHKTIPKTRNKFWSQKIENNKRRDKEVNKYYKSIGWKIIRVWEHDLRLNTLRLFKLN